MDAPSPTPPPVSPNFPQGPPATNWRLYFELLQFTAFVFPVGQIVGPLILWLVKKDSDATADAAGKQVINFNISWLLWTIASCGFGIFVWLVIAIIATIKAANNEPFKHPWTIGFLK